MPTINRLCFLIIALDCLTWKLLGQDCTFAVVEYAVPTSWTALPDPDNPTTTITAIGCLLQGETTVVIIRAFVNGVPKDMVAIPRGSITKSTILTTVAPDPNKLPTNLPTVRVKNETLQGRRPVKVIQPR